MSNCLRSNSHGRSLCCLKFHIIIRLVFLLAPTKCLVALPRLRFRSLAPFFHRQDVAWFVTSTQRHLESDGERFSSRDEWPISVEDRSSSGLEEDEVGNVHIPSLGISLEDALDSAQKDGFVTQVVPIQELSGVAKIVTTARATTSFEPTRYLLSLRGSSTTDTSSHFVMIDVPPYTVELSTQIKEFMGTGSTLLGILITSRDAIHYDEAAGVFSLRRADLDRWQQAFPGLRIVAYRLDIPRDCREAVTQVLDGNGPFALDLGKNYENFTFVEAGRPLTRDEWDHASAESILNGQRQPPDDLDCQKNDADESFSPAAIRAREEGRNVLAVHTPGHTYGSVSYIFPTLNVCVSGYTIPIEEEGESGPALDCRGYLTTNRAGMQRQVISARTLIQSYNDRFHVILPSRGSTVWLDENERRRKKSMMDFIDQYDKLGRIYSQLGITEDNIG